MTIKKRKLTFLGDNLLEVHKDKLFKRYKSKLISTYAMNRDFKDKLKYERNKKTKKAPQYIYPRFYHYSQHDIEKKYPFYYYFIEDVERYSEFKNIDYKLKRRF